MDLLCSLKNFEINRNDFDCTYYKNLADQKVRECSVLAEEIICLRTDLDRSHTTLLQLQRGIENGQVREKKVFQPTNQNTFSLKNIACLRREDIDQYFENEKLSGSQEDKNYGIMKSIALLRNDLKENAVRQV